MRAKFVGESSWRGDFTVDPPSPAVLCSGRAVAIGALADLQQGR